MKITRAQKDAVISLLREKFNEKQKVANEAYEKNNKSKINSEIKAFLQDQDKLESLLIAAKEIILKWKIVKVDLLQQKCPLRMDGIGRKLMNYLTSILRKKSLSK